MNKNKSISFKNILDYKFSFNKDGFSICLLTKNNLNESLKSKLKEIYLQYNNKINNLKDYENLSQEEYINELYQHFDYKK